MNVPFLDLKQQYKSIKSEIDSAINKVLEHGLFVMGPELAELEQKIASYCEVKYGIGVASGTDALLLSLRALGVGPGDEVITTTFSFFATAGVITRLGARPVFVDIDERTFNMSAGSLLKAITKNTRVIMPVHLYGQITDMDSIMEIASSKKIPIVEDAAQAIGSKYKGRAAGNFGATACFSFFPTKNLGAYGDGGLIVTNDDSLNDSLKMLRVHGAKSKYYHTVVGYNSRLDSIQAAVLIVKMKHLERWNEIRRQNAGKYDAALANIEEIKIPRCSDQSFHTYHQYTIQTADRDPLKDHLRQLGVSTDTYYPLPLHLQECYKGLGYKKGSFPISEKVADQALSLPITPELTAAQQDLIIESIIKFFK